MSDSESLEEGEIEPGEVVVEAPPFDRGRTRDLAYTARSGVESNRRDPRAEHRSGRRRERSRSRSWSRSRSRSPVATFTTTTRRNGRGDDPRLHKIINLTANVALADCLRDLNGVCKRLMAALTAAQQYLHDLQGESKSGTANSRDLKAAIGGIMVGLRALNVMSTTGRGREMAPAKDVARFAWKHRQELFDTGDCTAMESWKKENRHYRALLEDQPAVVPRKPPPQKASVVEKKEPQKAVAVAGVDLGKQGKKGQKSLERKETKENVDIKEVLRRSGCNQVVYSLLSAGKMCLVLDLDHTLLHSIMFSEIAPPLGKWLEDRIQAEERLPDDKRSIYRIDSIQMFTKLRPGNIAYAAAVIPFLDPTGSYFQGRIIAQGAERQEDMQADQPKALAAGLAAREPIAMVVDDSYAVWQAHIGSLVAIERYLYFPSNRTPPSARGRTLLEKNRDEDANAGMLMMTLELLERTYNSVFEALKSAPGGKVSGGNDFNALPPWDVRKVLSKERKKVLHGVNLVFSRVIPLEQDPKTHELWQMAELFGATCRTAIDSKVTHLIAADGSTEKAAAARAAGIAVVSPQWLKGCFLLWKRLDEKQYRI